ncbi:T9SS C-terminal target domain-containing protein [Echinicola jeungdonensis]|uniref:T9SS C-terminal target domain-containing protein n=1 Tax=Echinicola jeungdonensis TaxID=709343 RepID=A0ABV5JB87_9BACT|nr:T9SS C-terminal target domain-containing protein [Echinicola jeungdonensis]MDN3670517.1 T9SS C-terminal target domain-containing protein [Echinicola jeungdonensis]
MKSVKLNFKKIQQMGSLLLLGCIFQVTSSFAQQPIIKADFDFEGRRESEVNEPGYFPWRISENKVQSQDFDGVEIEVKGNIRSNWYKAGVQAPYYARWVNDGLVSDGPLEMTIKGLPNGKHSLLTVHNAFDNPENHTFAPLDIYLNGKQVIDNLQPSVRAESNIEGESGYLTFEVENGESVSIRIEADPDSNADINEVVLNGFEINTPNVKLQAKVPFPEDGDEHVETEGILTLNWTPSKDAVSHQVYFGKNREALKNADKKSTVYQGQIKSNEFQVGELYSMDTYFWRVDEVGEDGEVTKGDVWYFRPAQLAFPGAEGYGRYARGGRGGKVVAVTNLNDDGPGSLREAVTNDIGPRTIVFNVSGTIELKSRLVINDPYVTIAGQTAPGKGILISRAPLGVTGNDNIARFIRVGIGAGRTFDGMGLTGANHSIMDHCSIRWTIDESFSSRGAHNITLQRTLIAEALNVADHGKYEGGKMHGYAATIGGDIGSFHHNLLAHCYGRNWSMGGGLDGNGYYTGRLDIRNNVVYNWGHRTTDGGAHEVNFVNNYYKPGAGTTLFYALTMDHEGVGLGSQRAYFSGNVMPGHFDAENQEKGKRSRISNNEKVNYKTFVEKPFFPSHVNTHSARDAYKNVLSDVGANQPELDEHDQRIIQETLDSTFTYKGSISGIPGMPDTEQDVGGWENYPEEKRSADWDRDQDGLPTWWEIVHGLNPDSKRGDFTETNQDKDKDGFTQLDNYLAWMAEPHYFLKEGETLELDAEKLFRGYTKNPVYYVSSVEKGEIEIEQNGKVIYQASSKGLDTIKLMVKDDEGSKMAREVNIYID